MKNILSRRALLGTGIIGLTGITLGAGWSLRQKGTSSIAEKITERWVSAQGRNQDLFSAAWIQPKLLLANPKLDSLPSSITKQEILTGFRGHGLCQNPTRPEEIVMIARRPGTSAILFDVNKAEIKSTVQCEKNHHMQGHACFSADGKFLYCSESNFSTGEGRITVRDGKTLEYIKDFSSYGIGPHEIALMPDQTTLVIANGGLLTHPESGRKVLNLKSMRSLLTYIDSRDGRLLSEHHLSESLPAAAPFNLDKASIRHLSVAQDGTVAIAMQVQRTAMSSDTLVPLTALHKPGQRLKLLTAPTTLTQKLDDYIGSVVIHNQNRIAAFASPKGNLVLFWHLDDKSLQGYHAFHDVCGLAISSDKKYFVLSNSAGKIRQINSRTLQEDTSRRLHIPNTQWDNHMLSVTS